jgi:LDH2 family malate/lactate/ureidoglycolate dehydrogenase
VRVPGDAAAKSIIQAEQHGISYDAATWQGLRDWANQLGVTAPV